MLPCGPQFATTRPAPRVDAVPDGEAPGSCHIRVSWQGGCDDPTTQEADTQVVWNRVPREHPAEVRFVSPAPGTRVERADAVTRLGSDAARVDAAQRILRQVQAVESGVAAQAVGEHRARGSAEAVAGEAEVAQREAIADLGTALRRTLRGTPAHEEAMRARLEDLLDGQDQYLLGLVPGEVHELFQRALATAKREQRGEAS